ncbi:MAG TPA: Spy/CpxP family protein refolding chaperone [Polyangia bacterium]|nr:Spy/CpxP family protein refolding chaperone [Polyangia bacterium]
MRTEQTHIPNSTTPQPRRAPSRSWRFLAPALAVLTLGGGVAATAAYAHPGEPMEEGAEMNGGEMGFGARRLEHLLDKVNATPAQRSQIEAIWNNLRPQMKANHEQHMGLHQQMAAAFTAPTINAAQIEQLRRQSMAIADKRSQLFTQGLVQTAEVLTQDQRKQAQALIQEARGRFHHHGGPQE